jgi:hypothetical protein
LKRFLNEQTGPSDGKTIIIIHLPRYTQLTHGGMKLDKGKLELFVRWSMSALKEITVQEVFDLFVESGACQLIDVRELDEFAECNATNRINVPLRAECSQRRSTNSVWQERTDLHYLSIGSTLRGGLHDAERS